LGGGEILPRSPLKGHNRRGCSVGYAEKGKKRQVMGEQEEKTDSLTGRSLLGKLKYKRGGEGRDYVKKKKKNKKIKETSLRVSTRGGRSSVLGRNSTSTIGPLLTLRV